jgi:hypothetical protein
MDGAPSYIFAMFYIIQRGNTLNLYPDTCPLVYSVSLEVNAKGWVQPSVHVYSDESKDVSIEATNI